MKIPNPTSSVLLSILFLTSCAITKQQKTAELNKQTVLLWFEEGWNNDRHEELLAQCFTEDWEDGHPVQAGQTAGLDGMRGTITNYKSFFSDSHFDITHVVATDKQVAVRYEFSGTHTGEMLNIPASGKKFSSTGIAIFEMENGKIRKSWHEIDMLGIINQLK